MMMAPFVRNCRFSISTGKYTEADLDVDYGYARDYTVPAPSFMAAPVTQNTAATITPSASKLWGLTLDGVMRDGDGGYTRVNLSGTTYAKAFFGMQVSGMVVGTATRQLMNKAPDGSNDAISEISTGVWSSSTDTPCRFDDGASGGGVSVKVLFF